MGQSFELNLSHGSWHHSQMLASTTSSERGGDLVGSSQPQAFLGLIMWSLGARVWAYDGDARAGLCSRLDAPYPGPCICLPDL